ncbi:MAG: Dihydroorotate dehydrogenase B (NAD(+)), catalytic subunit [Firmicutes bacterium]|nr:Dihydroorotate dehydrogenase B (NAD(+)), catalytic subunit [Bacillota bacterium]
MEKINPLATSLAGLSLSSPLVTASGTCGYARELSQFFDLGMLGAIVVKGITLAPRTGNPGTRLIETPAGLINSIGLENPGVEKFISGEMPFLRQQHAPVIVNISGNTEEEYAALAARLDKVAGVSALEVNISCPNVKTGGMAFGACTIAASRVTTLVRQHSQLPLIVKLSPNVTDIAAIARAVEDAGADAISLINTLLGMAIDIETRRPILRGTFGGLSGPAIKPVALRMVYQVFRAVKIPVIGMGGISTWQDAAEFILAGATAVGIGTASMVNPLVIPTIHQGLQAYATRQGVRNIAELRGMAHQ